MFSDKRLLLLDVETVPIVSNFDQLSEPMQQHWMHKSLLKYPNETREGTNTWERAGIYAEFGKIVCISVGYFMVSDNEPVLMVQSFIGNEDELLRNFFEFIQTFKPDQLGGHNIREFDIPYICRRSFIQQVALPPLFARLQASKPWESPMLDTLQMWKFGEYKNYVSVDLLCTILGIASPKQAISGKDVAGVYWQERNIGKIAEYCEQDVLAVARILMRLMGKETTAIQSLSCQRHERNKRDYPID